MGFALAQAAAQMGAQVTLVTGIVHLETTHPNITRIDVTTAEDMYEAMVKAFPDHDVVIKAAAVADYRPKQTFKDKMKKQSGEWHIEMERTKDILRSEEHTSELQSRGHLVCR